MEQFFTEKLLLFVCETNTLNKTFDGVAETVMLVFNVEFSDVFRVENIGVFAH